MPAVQSILVLRPEDMLRGKIRVTAEAMTPQGQNVPGIMVVLAASPSNAQKKVTGVPPEVTGE
jgi:hypothetical protein